MAFFNGKKRSKLFVAFLLTLSMIAVFALPISIYAAGDNAREPTLTEGTPVEEGLGLTPAENLEQGTPTDPEQGTPVAPEQGTPAAIEQGTPTDPEQGTPTDPEQGTPTDPEQGTPTDPEQGTPADPEQGAPTDPEQGTPADPAPVVDPPATEEEVTTDPAITVEETATEPAIVVEPVAATLTITHRLIVNGYESDFTETIDGLTVGQSVNLADYVLNMEGVGCLSDLKEISISEENSTVVLEYTFVESDSEGSAG